MAIYVIGYDLHRPGRNYPELFEAIQSLDSNWWHCLDSTWLVGSLLGASQIRDRLKRHIDANDSLIVLEIASNWATAGLADNCNEWLRNRVAR